MKKKYTCNEYREEMILAGLRQRLAKPGLSDEERKQLIEDIKKMEKTMGM